LVRQNIFFQADREFHSDSNEHGCNFFVYNEVLEEIGKLFDFPDFSAVLFGRLGFDVIINFFLVIIGFDVFQIVQIGDLTFDLLYFVFQPQLLKADRDFHSESNGHGLGKLLYSFVAVFFGKLGFDVNRKIFLVIIGFDAF